jgi:hypothetical protein
MSQKADYSHRRGQLTVNVTEFCCWEICTSPYINRAWLPGPREVFLM